MLAEREPFPGVRLNAGLGVNAAMVDVVLVYATDIDLPLQIALRHNRTEYAQHLLDAGANTDQPGTRSTAAG